MKMSSVAAGLAAVLLGATSAHAALVGYADFASWSSAVSSTATVTIPDPSSQNGYDFFGSGPGTGDGSVTYSGVNFSANPALGNGNFFNIGPIFSGSAAVLNSQEQSSGLANILITFLKPTTAFSLNYGTFGGSQVTFLLSNGDKLTQNSSMSGYTVTDFVGITDTAFTSILVTSPDDNLSLNNLVYAVPEGSTWFMMLLGLSLIGLVYRHSWRGDPIAVGLE